MTEDNQQYTLGGMGARLKIAREALHLSQKDVATRLHLGTRIIQIIESEDLQQAPPATFMRGYLRSYAKLLNVTDEDINAALANSGLDLPPKVTAPSMLMQTESFPRSDRYVHGVTMLVLAISLVLVGIWWNSHSREASSSVAQIATQNPANTAEPTQPTPAAIANESTPAVVTPTPTTGAVATTTQTNPTPATPVTQPAPTPTNNAFTPSDATPTAPVAPALPPTGAMPPLATMSPIQQPPTETASTDSHKKSHRHQDNNVSGMAMALPEPGLE